MRSHLPIRIATVVITLAAATGGALAAASPAAAIQSCNGGYTPVQTYYGVTSTTPQYVEVTEVAICYSNPALNINFAVSISKYIGNSGWQVVATGKGDLTYPCTGGRYLYTTSVTTAANQPAFYCG